MPSKSSNKADQQRHTTTKKEMVELIHARTGLPVACVREILQTMLDTSIEILAGGGRIEFRDFAIFETTMRDARSAQNPRTMAPVHVPRKAVVKFKPGKKMREAVERSAHELTLVGEQTGQIEPKPGVESLDGQQAELVLEG